MSNQKNIAIIGAGAAGIFAAVNFAEKNAGARVTVFESNNKALSKVLISGGGRCNVTNYRPEPRELAKNYPRGGRELLGPMTTFGVKETMFWFENRGVPLKIEEDNRVFPVSDSSESIADCLMSSAMKAGVKIRYKEKVESIKKGENFTVHLKDHTEEFDSILITTGGSEKGFRLAESLGHSIIAPVPSLFTFEIKHPLIEELSGVSFKDSISTIHIGKKRFDNRGPLLITHWGLSGPSIIVLSSIAARELHDLNYAATLKVNFIPHLTLEESIKTLKDHREKNLSKPLNRSNPFQLPNSFWERLISMLNFDKNLSYQSLSKSMIMAIVNNLRSTSFQINGKGKFKEEFVTAGGINLKEINFKTMESKICKNLYFAGEVLNIDGVTGGFNFQSAWTGAWIASQNM